MGKFSGVGDAKVSQSGVYFLANKGPGHTKDEPNWVPARYKVAIKRVHTITSRKKEDLFIVEAKILESDCPDRPEGMGCSWVVNMKQDAALGNIKGFIAAANGIDPSSEEEVDAEVTEEVCETVVSNANPLEGTEVGLECVMIKTREDKDFTLHRWYPTAG